MGSLNATITPLIAAGAVSMSRVNAPPAIRGTAGRKLLGGDLANSLAGDLDTLNSAVNSLQAAAKVSQKLSQLTLSSAGGSIVFSPAIPSIIVTATGGGTITVSAAVPSIDFVSAAGSVSIDAFAASLTVKNSIAAEVAFFGNGATPRLAGVDVGGNEHVTGNSVIDGTLASGNLTVTGTLGVSGTAATGALTVTGALIVSSTAATGALTVTGDIAASGMVSCTLLATGEISLAAKAAAPTAPGAGFAFLYYDNVIGALRYNLAGAGWVNVSTASIGGANTQVQFNNTGAFAGSADLTWNNGVSILSAKFLLTNAITVTVGGIDATGVVLMRNVPQFAGTNTTGAGLAVLTANCPAVTPAAPYTWIQVTTADNSTAYIPAWK